MQIRQKYVIAVHSDALTGEGGLRENVTLRHISVSIVDSQIKYLPHIIQNISIHFRKDFFF